MYYLCVCSDIQITAPSQQILIYESNDTVQCSSDNSTEERWRTVHPDESISKNETYSFGQGGLKINNVQLHHAQRYKCQHILLSNPALSKSAVIDVTVHGKQIKLVCLV